MTEVAAGADRIRNILFQGKCSLLCFIYVFRQYKRLKLTNRRHKGQDSNEVGTPGEGGKNDTNSLNTSATAAIHQRNVYLHKFYTTFLSKVLPSVLIHMGVEINSTSIATMTTALSMNKNSSLISSNTNTPPLDLLSSEAYDCLRVMTESLLESDLKDMTHDLAASLRLITIESLTQSAGAGVGVSSVISSSVAVPNTHTSRSSLLFQPAGPVLRFMKAFLSSARFSNYRRFKYQHQQADHDNALRIQTPRLGSSLDSADGQHIHALVSNTTVQYIFLVLKGILTLHATIPIGCETAFFLLDWYVFYSLFHSMYVTVYFTLFFCLSVCLTDLLSFNILL